MRLSYVSPFSKSVHRKNIIQYAVLAEDLGFEAVWVPEAFGSDAFTLLGSIANQTHRIRLGTGIVNVFSRSPTLLAQSFATLDEMSNGRTNIGLGVSGPLVVEDWHGMNFEKPLTRLRETVNILNMALSGKRVDYEGVCFQLRGFRLLMRPIQENIPIYLATLKTKAVRETGAIANGWLPTHLSIRHLKDSFRPLIQGAELMKRKATEIDIAALTLVACADDGESARNLCREHLAYYIGGMGTYYHELFTKYGNGALADEIQTLWKANKRQHAAKIIPREVLDDVVIAGTPEECLEAIDLRRKAGLNHIVLFPPHNANAVQVLSALKQCSKYIN